MTGDEFREIALNLPEAEEGSHMDHPDFRVGGKIFATLGSDETWGMVKLTPSQQAMLMSEESDIVAPANGVWGRRGATIIKLRRAKKNRVRQAVLLAWRNTAPKRLLRELDSH